MRCELAGRDGTLHHQRALLPQHATTWFIPFLYHPPILTLSVARRTDVLRLPLTIKQLEAITEQFRQIITDRTGQPLDTVQRWLAPGMDTYFSPAEAVAAGLAHALVQPVASKGIEHPDAVPGGVSVGSTPARWTEDETLLLDVLAAVGPVKTNDRGPLMRELRAWCAAYAR